MDIEPRTPREDARRPVSRRTGSDQRLPPDCGESGRPQESRRAGVGGGSWSRVSRVRATFATALSNAAQVLRLHEALCFRHACTDNPRVLRTAVRLRRNFGERGDLQAHREELTDAGISSPSVFDAFYSVTAIWLARRWGRYLSIDWEWFEGVTL